MALKSSICSDHTGNFAGKRNQRRSNLAIVLINFSCSLKENCDRQSKCNSVKLHVLVINVCPCVCVCLYVCV